LNTISEAFYQWVDALEAAIAPTGDSTANLNAQIGSAYVAVKNSDIRQSLDVDAVFAAEEFLDCHYLDADSAVAELVAAGWIEPTPCVDGCGFLVPVPAMPALEDASR
jgi:hypothetical protein